MMLRNGPKIGSLGCLALGTVVAFCSSAEASTIAIQGSVFDDSGKPVPGAHVLISAALPPTVARFAAPPVITGPLVTMVVASAQGSFSVPTLSPGQYVACAEVTTPGLLDPCHWAASAPTFTVTAGTVVTGVNITMARGAIVPIHVDDPKALLKPLSGPIDFDLQIHVVTSKGFHYNAAVQASGPLSRDLAATIPFGIPVSVRVLSSHLVVNDQSGNPVSQNAASVTVPAGVSPSTVAFVVAGTK